MVANGRWARVLPDAKQPTPIECYPRVVTHDQGESERFKSNYFAKRLP